MMLVLVLICVYGVLVLSMDEVSVVGVMRLDAWIFVVLFWRLQACSMSLYCFCSPTQGGFRKRFCLPINFDIIVF